MVQRLRLVNEVPLNASNADVRVNCIAYWERGHGQTQHLSGVTDLRVSTRTVYRLMRGGRARWKIDNETCNPLKNQGDSVCGRPNATAVLCVVPSRLDKTRQQAAVVGAHAGVV